MDYYDTEKRTIVLEVGYTTKQEPTERIVVIEHEFDGLPDREDILQALKDIRKQADCELTHLTCVTMERNSK